MSTVTPSGTSSMGIPRQSTASAASVAFPASMRRYCHGISVPTGALSAAEPEQTITRVSSQGSASSPVRSVPDPLRHSQLAAELRLVPSPAPVHVAVAATLSSRAYTVLPSAESESAKRGSVTPKCASASLSPDGSAMPSVTSATSPPS